MTYYRLEDIHEDLEYVNRILKRNNLFLNLRVVGGAALLFNGIHSYETEDIDTLSSIEEQVKEVLDDCSIDVNNDVLDYLEEFDDLDFVKDDYEFYNISIEYLDLGGVIKTKMRHSDQDKLEAVAYVLEEELKIDMSPDSLFKWFRDTQDVHVSYEEIEDFLMQVGYM